VVRRGNTHYFVPVGDVDWLDAADNSLRLHVGGRVHLARGTLKGAAEELDPARFARIHRSAIVAVDRVVAVHNHPSGRHVVELRGGMRLRSSRQYADEVRRLRR
jgi:two-component system LytT family response regulator